MPDTLGLSRGFSTTKPRKNNRRSLDFALLRSVENHGKRLKCRFLDSSAANSLGMTAGTYFMSCNDRGYEFHVLLLGITSVRARDGIGLRVASVLSLKFLA